MSKHKKLYTTERCTGCERSSGSPKGRYGVLPDTDDVDIFLNQVACCQLQMHRKKLGLPRLGARETASQVLRPWQGTALRVLPGLPLPIPDRLALLTQLGPLSLV